MSNRKVTFALEEGAIELLKQNVISHRKIGRAVSAAIFLYYQAPVATPEPGVLERIEGLLEEMITLLDSRLPAK